jgi:hypothetical protein
MKRRSPRQAASPIPSPFTWDIKISHLFKRLTLSAGAHFVNSFPPCPAGVFTPRKHARLFFRTGSIPYRKNGKGGMKLKIALTGKTDFVRLRFRFRGCSSAGRAHDWQS